MRRLAFFLASVLCVLATVPRAIARADDRDAGEPAPRRARVVVGSALGAGTGAVLGAGVGFGVIAGIAQIEQPGERLLLGLVVGVPALVAGIAFGSGLGAYAGGNWSGGHSALYETLCGAAIGTSLGAAAALYIAAQDPSDDTAPLLFASTLLLPAAGAVIGYALGDRSAIAPVASASPDGAYAGVRIRF